MEQMLQDISDAVTSGVLHFDDGARLSKIVVALETAPDHPRGHLATHCVSLLIAVANVVKYSPPGQIDLDHFRPDTLHLCPTYLDAAVLLLAHGFEQNDNGSSPVFDFAMGIVDKLVTEG